MEDSLGYVNACGDWTRTVERIRGEDPEAEAELYQTLLGFKAFFAIRLGREEADDRYHDLIMAIITSIKSARLRESGKVAGYAKSVARNMVFERLRASKRFQQLGPCDSWQGPTDSSPSPEAAVIDLQARATARLVLDDLPARDRAVLVRFYVQEENARRICEDMKLSDSQFRNIKSRAKARYTELVQQRIGPKIVTRQALERKSA